MPVMKVIQSPAVHKLSPASATARTRIYRSSYNEIDRDFDGHKMRAEDCIVTAACYIR